MDTKNTIEQGGWDEKGTALGTCEFIFHDCLCAVFIPRCLSGDTTYLAGSDECGIVSVWISAHCMGSTCGKEGRLVDVYAIGRNCEIYGIDSECGGSL